MIESTVNDFRKDDGGFPKLMTYADSERFVFLVQGFKEGDMIGIAIDPVHFGVDANQFTSAGLVDFHGSVTLRNAN